MLFRLIIILFFFFNDTATTEIYTLSLHDALPLLELFEQKHYRFVTLDAALSDPAYNTPDAFVPRFSKYGPMWAYRWAAELGVRVNGALESEPPAWMLQYVKEPR